GRVGVAGGEHGVSAAGVLFLFADTAEFVADLAQSDFNGFDFDEQVADFLQKIVKVIRAHNVRHAAAFEGMGEMAAGHRGDKIEDAQAATIFWSDVGKFAKDGEDRTVDGNLANVGDKQRPFGTFEFAEENGGVGNDADAPAFCVKNLAKSGCTSGVVVQDENVDLARRDRLRRGRHFRSIALGMEAMWEKGCWGT